MEQPRAGVRIIQNAEQKKVYAGAVKPSNPINSTHRCIRRITTPEKTNVPSTRYTPLRYPARIIIPPNTYACSNKESQDGFNHIFIHEVIPEHSQKENDADSENAIDEDECSHRRSRPIVNCVGMHWNDLRNRCCCGSDAHRLELHRTP